MKFCPECDSMLYYVEHNNKLLEKCKSCNYFSECNDKIIETSMYKLHNTETIGSKSYIIYDNTLPRTTNKNCINGDCPSKKDINKKEMVFYPNPVNMKLIYICTACNTQFNM